MLGLGLAAGFLALAAITVFVPNLRGQWLPLHLSRLRRHGGHRCGDAVLRLGARGRTAGAGANPARHRGAPGHEALAVTGGLLFIAGLILLLGLTLSILRGSIGAQRRMFTVIYGTAIVNVMVGATIATLFLGLQPDVAAAWATLKPAHAWLNLFGFVSLVICSSLVHLFPTVIGARMDRSGWSAGAVMALTAAPPIVALGYALRVDLVAQAGGIVMAAGTGAQLVAAARTWRRRSGWTSDAAWHTMAMGGLWCGLGWFSAGVAIASSRLLADGARPEGWSITPLIAPLGIGFVIQVMIGAWTHLPPAIGPGSPAVHGVARARLGRLALPRLAMLNAGVALMVFGQANDRADVSRAGLALAGLAIVASLALFAFTATGVTRAAGDSGSPRGAVRPEPRPLGG